MAKKVRDRTTRRQDERAARRTVRDRERLAVLSPGGAPDRPIDVPSSAVIEPRVRSLRCPQCDGVYDLVDHQAAAAGLRTLTVKCRTCHVARQLWFRLGAPGAVN